MHANYACQSQEHLLARRTFLGAAGGAIVGGLGIFTGRSQAEQLASQQKRVVVFNMHGGLSQLETWDPKPGTDTGGPFLAIPWLLIVVIVLALPLLTAAVVGLTARSRLPLVARLD